MKNMTTVERKRAMKLEKTARAYGAMGNANKMLAFLTIAVFIIDIAMFHIAIEDDQLYVLFVVHSFFLSLFSALIVIMNTYPIGDTGFMIDTGAVVQSGSAYTGKFLCTLPFEAKDLLNLRFITFEKQISIYTITIVFLYIAAEILQKTGYTMESEYIGICCLTGILFEVLLLVILLTRMKSHYAIGVMFVPAIPIIIFCEYMDGLSEEAAAETMKIFSPLNIFSGVPGIILMIIAAAAMAFIGELCLKHKKDVSWNIK